MMTLADMASFVCAKLGRTDADSISICKDFINARYKVLWDSALWTDTQSVVSVTSTANHQFVLMPEGVERVLQVRDSTNDVLLGNIQSGTFMALSPNDFDVAGATVAFAQAPAAVAYVAGLSAVEMNPLDVGKSYAVTTESSAGVVATTNWVAAYSGDFEDPFSLLDQQIASGSYILSFSKEVTDYDIDVNDILIVANYATFTAESTIAPTRARIRLLQKNTEALSLLCLVKGRCLGLEDDRAVPGIRNSVNALLAYGLGDMLERDRQYAKAERKFMEGAAQVKVMSDGENNQQANIMRLTPEDDHVDFLNGRGFTSKGYW